MSTQAMPLNAPRARARTLLPWGISALAHLLLLAAIAGRHHAAPEPAPLPVPIAVQIVAAPQTTVPAAPVNPALRVPAPASRPQRAPAAVPRHVTRAALAAIEHEPTHASPAPHDPAPAPAPSVPSAPSTPPAAPTLPASPPPEPLTPPIGNAAYLHNPAPRYPPSALEEGWEGCVVLRVHVDAAGHPLGVDVRTSSGHDVLDKAALAAVRQWMFVPAKRGSTPVDGWVDVPLNFHMN